MQLLYWFVQGTQQETTPGDKLNLQTGVKHTRNKMIRPKHPAKDTMRETNERKQSRPTAKSFGQMHTPCGGQRMKAHTWPWRPLMQWTRRQTSGRQKEMKAQTLESGSLSCLLSSGLGCCIRLCSCLSLVSGLVFHLHSTPVLFVVLSPKADTDGRLAARKRPPTRERRL